MFFTWSDIKTTLAIVQQFRLMSNWVSTIVPKCYFFYLRIFFAWKIINQAEKLFAPNQWNATGVSGNRVLMLEIMAANTTKKN